MKRNQRRLVVVLGFAISAVFLIVIGLSDPNLPRALEYIQKANFALLVIAGIWYFSSVAVISLRWQSLLNATKRVPLLKLIHLVCITYMGNNLFPLRAGEILRVVLLRRDEGVPVASGGTVAIAERIFDGIVMLTFVIVSLVLLNVASSELRQVALVTAPIFVVALLVFFLLALRPNILRRLIALISRILPGKLGALAHKLGEEVIAGLEGLRSPGDLAKTVFFSYTCWMLEASTYWVVSLAFNLDVPYTAMLLVVGVVNLAGLIPASPGGIGVYEFFGILALTAIGVDKTQATAFIFVNHLVIWLPVTMVGVFLLTLRGLRLGDVTHVDRLEQEVVAS